MYQRCYIINIALLYIIYYLLYYAYIIHFNFLGCKEHLLHKLSKALISISYYLVENIVRRGIASFYISRPV